MLLVRLEKHNLVTSFISLTTVEWKEFLPGSSLSHLGHWSRNNDLSLFSGICIVAITISMDLLPCAASSTWTWVNQLLTLVQWLGWCRTTTYHNFETLSHLGHLCTGFAMTSWRSTERLGDVSSESVVSHLVFWVSSCVVLVLCLVGFCFWLGLICLVLEDTWPFAFTYSPTCGNSLSKTIRFDDRQSLERARHELKKKRKNAVVRLLPLRHISSHTHDVASTFTS